MLGTLYTNCCWKTMEDLAAVLQSLCASGLEKKLSTSETGEGEKSHLHYKFIIINLKFKLL